MKAIAIIDVPDNMPVNDMQIFGNIYKGKSRFREKIGSFAKTRLIALPEQKKIDYFDYWYKKGWNECLKQIEGEEDEQM